MAKPKNIIVADLDGTIALDDHRAEKYLRSPDGVRHWDQYFEACTDDKPCWPVIQLINAMSRYTYEIWILSGRKETVRPQTKAWLEKHGVPYNKLIMRPTDDRTDDYKLKIQWLEAFELRERLLFVLEDRQRVVDAWRSEGITCFQVAPGNF
jgi:hypothetical protein